MFTWLISLFTGPIISSIFGSVVDAYKLKLEKANERDRLAVDLAVKEIEAEIEARKAAKEIIIAEQGRWYTAIVRPLLAFPIVIYLWKVVVWDIVLGWGVTDPINGAVGEWAAWIVMAYVGGRSVEKVARIFNMRR